jgi:hypothetical protein
MGLEIDTCLTKLPDWQAKKVKGALSAFFSTA